MSRRLKLAGYLNSDNRFCRVRKLELLLKSAGKEYWEMSYPELQGGAEDELHHNLMLQENQAWELAKVIANGEQGIGDPNNEETIGLIAEELSDVSGVVENILGILRAAPHQEDPDGEELEAGPLDLDEDIPF